MATQLQPSGVSLPERQTAQQTAQASGSTSKAATGGNKGVPQINENPIAAIGVVLSEVAAGLQGRPSPISAMQKEELAREQLELQRTQLGLSAIGEAAKLAKIAPMAEREGVFRGVLGKFSAILPEQTVDAVSGMFKSDPARMDTVLSLVGDKENATVLHSLTGGDPEKMLELAQDKDFMGRLGEATDRRNGPRIMAKFRGLQESLALHKDGAKFLSQLAADGWTVNDLRNLPKEFGFTDSELQTLSRSEAVQSELVPFGFVPPKTLLDTQKAGLEARAREAAKPIKFEESPFKAALAMRTSNQEVGADLFGEKIAEKVNAMSPAQAAQVRQNLKGGALQVTLPDGTTIDFGGGGTKAEQAGAVTEARETAKERVKAKSDFALRGVEMTNLGSILNKVNSLPEGSTGLRGAAIEAVGGYLGQVSPQLETSFARLISGDAKPEEIQAFRTQARTAIAQNIATVSGEESGRFTEMERKVTESTLRILESGASKTQIQAALGELISLKVMLRDFSRMKAGIGTQYDLDAEKGIAAFAIDMLDFGLQREQIVDLGQRLKTMRAQVKPAFDPAGSQNGDKR